MPDFKVKVLKSFKDPLSRQQKNKSLPGQMARLTCKQTIESMFYNYIQIKFKFNSCYIEFVSSAGL